MCMHIVSRGDDMAIERGDRERKGGLVATNIPSLTYSGSIITYCDDDDDDDKEDDDDGKSV